MLDDTRQAARGRPMPPLVEAKLSVPEAPEHLVTRRRILSEMELRGSAHRLYVTGPAGAGKSTLLAEWCRGQQLDSVVAWVSLDERDRDPVRLWSHVLESAERSIPGLGAEARAAVRSGAPLLEVVLPLFCNDLELTETAVTIALDDVHCLGHGQARDSIWEFAARLPSSTVLASASRLGLDRREQRWVVHGEAIHISAETLRFSTAETERLLEEFAGAPVESHLVEEAEAATLGWAVPLRLIAQRLHGGRASLGISGLEGVPLMDYLFAELLGALSREELDAFVVLATLGRFNRRLVEEIAPAGTPLLDPERREALGIRSMPGGWHLMHDLVREAVEARDNLRPTPARLAAAAHWYDDHGYQEEAIVCGAAVGEWDLVAELLNRTWPDYVEAGQLDTLRALLDLVPRPVVFEDSRILIAAAWLAGFQHDLVERDLLLDEVERRESSGEMPDGTESARHAASLNRALIPSDCRTLTAAADLVLELTPDGSRWRGYALMGAGNACMARGDLRGCQEAYLASAEHSDALFQAAAIGGAALAAALDADLQRAASLAERAARIRLKARLWHVPWLVMHEIAFGYIALRQGSARHAIAHFSGAEAGVAGMIEPYPHLCLLIGLAEAHHALGEWAAAGDALRRAEERASTAGDIGGYFETQLKEARRLFSVGSDAADVVAVETLTSRELTVLRLLATTQLSQSEIAESLHVSRNTVKTHTRAIYKKLQVGSRGRAAERARQLELV